MVRSLQVYPKAFLKGSTWHLSVRVGDSDFKHVVAAGVIADTPLLLLKLVFDLTVEDSDLDVFVDDALFKDDIHPSPGQTETVWGNWQEIAEGIISGLSPGYTVEDFWQAWTKSNTQVVRQDASRALASPSGRGWTITSVHQHEGDGTVETKI